jgi:phosphoglycerate dehydrogenase-like enzyme
MAGSLGASERARQGRRLTWQGLAVQILLSETAYAAHADRLAAADGPVEWLRVLPDGGLLLDGQPADPALVQPEVAWGTAHVFYDGTLEHFFSMLLTSESLRWFQSPAAGIDHPVFAMIVERGVRLTSSHGNSVAIAEYVVGAVLRAYQRPEEWADAQRERAWVHHEFRELYDTTWLVVGMGAIGSAVATRVRAFEAKVVGSRRHPTGDEPVDDMVAPADLGSVVPACDVVVLAAPATPETRHMVDATFLASMRAGSILVNVGRGSLVDEDALLVALDRGVPETAILDVFETEPLPDHSPLWTHPRVVITPHASAGGIGRHERNADLFLDNLARYRSGRRLRYEITAADLPD